MRIAELKEQVSIEEVIAYLGGREAGWTGGYKDRWVSWVCPFCSDKNGSASVQPQSGYFLCHQCAAPRDGKAGDILDVAMYELNTKDINEAKTWLERNFL